MLAFNMIRGEESHHQDPTKGGRTLGHRVVLLAFCQLRGSARRAVSACVSTRCFHGRYRDALGRSLEGLGSVRHERKTLDRLQSLPMPDNRTPRNTTSRRLNSSTFFDTRRRSRTPG